VSCLWISPDAFSTAAHAAPFAAIHSLPTPDPVEHAKNTKWLDAVLTAARDEARGLSASYLHSLIQVCPCPRHAPAYARIIEAEHSRRRLATAAQRLMHTARDTSLPQRVTTTLGEADALATVVDDIATRFPPHAGSLPRTPVPPPTTTHDEEAADEERLLLATATAIPSRIEQMRWLTPQRLHAPSARRTGFVHENRQHLYTSLGSTRSSAEIEQFMTSGSTGPCRVQQGPVV
jgi:hypothetical protein